MFSVCSFIDKNAGSLTDVDETESEHCGICSQAPFTILNQEIHVYSHLLVVVHEPTNTLCVLEDSHDSSPAQTVALLGTDPRHTQVCVLQALSFSGLGPLQYPSSTLPP